MSTAQPRSEFKISPGDVIAGKYRVERVLGAGGMGVVVSAHHIQLDEKVALKFLLPEVAKMGEAVARFDREARAAVKIKSEHVARVSDVGRLDTGEPYMVMEYLEGGDLADWIKTRGPLEIEQAVEFVLQACEAIAEAHALGMVHRDLKPANLFCIRRADGLLSVKVLDFGISKVTTPSGGGHDMGMTRTQSLMGSPLYMSPEQMQSSKNVDSRSDIWSLGVIIYELLAGKPPFCAEAIPELVLKIATEPAPRIRESRPEAPIELEQLILRCMEKNRIQRFQNVAELASALLPFAPKRCRTSVERTLGIIQTAGLSASALALPPSSETESQSPQPSNTNAAWGNTAIPVARPWKAPTAIIAGAIVLAGIAVWAFVSLRAPHSAPASLIAATTPAAVSPEVLPSATSPAVVSSATNDSAAAASSSAAAPPPPPAATAKTPANPSTARTGKTPEPREGKAASPPQKTATASEPTPPAPANTNALGGRL